MAGWVPLREPFIDLKTGRLMPVWERWFTRTLQPTVDEVTGGGGAAGGGGLDFTSIIEASLLARIEVLENLVATNALGTTPAATENDDAFKFYVHAVS